MEDAQRGSSGMSNVPLVVQRVPYDDKGRELGLLSIINVLLRERALVFWVSLSFVLLALVFAMIQPRTYTAESSFLTHTRGRGGELGQLTGVASQLGITMPSVYSDQSPQFYSDLLRSRRVLKAAATSTYQLGSQDSEAERLNGDLIALFNIDASSRDRAVAQAVTRLRNDLSVSANPETGIVEFSVSMPSRELAHAVAKRLIELIKEFDVEVRQSQAVQKREFVKKRLDEARTDLRDAEEELETFLKNNRRYENSPELVFERQRLQRQVDLRQQVFTSLALSLEEARIEAVRATPVLSLVNPPELPPRPDSRNYFQNGVLALFLGGMLAVGWAFTREFNRTAAKEEAEEFDEYETLKREAISELKSLWSSSVQHLRKKIS